MARRLISIAAAGGLLILLSPASVAAAPVGSAPVTRPDTVKLRAQAEGVFDLAANDTDPDGDEVRVCRVGDLPRQLHAEVVEGQLGIVALTTRPGTYTFTYYACDTGYLTPGTVTVKVGPPAPTLEILPTKQRGKLRIVNTFKGQTFRCEWRAEDADPDSAPDGAVTVRPQSSVVITVRDQDVVIDCESPRSGYGFVFTGLPLP